MTESTGENCIMSDLRHPLVATSITIFPGKFYATAAANRVLETPPTDTPSQKNITKQAPEKCTDGNMAT
jgi:hypothetical protein